MEPFYLFNSEHGVFAPTDIKEIKQMLLSGDRNQILQSVEKIQGFLNNDDFVALLIRSDISEFLCDAVIPFDGAVVGGIYNCLELMTRHVDFFSHNHSCFVIESLIRSLHFLMKNSGSSTSLTDCVNLLAVVIQGFSTYSVAPEKKTIESVLELLPTIIQKSLPTVNNKYIIGQLILGLTNLNTLQWSQNSCETILTSFHSWFNFLNEIVESVHPLRQKLIVVCLMLCHSVLRSIISAKELNLEISCDLNNDLFVNIRAFLINLATLYFDSEPFINPESDLSHLETFYQTVLYFCSDHLNSQKHHLTHGLCEVGFIQFTTRIVSFVDFSHGDKLRTLCVVALFQVILSLSEDVFQFPEVWPAGRDDFRNEVQRGVVQLPLDASQWLDVLASPHSTLSCKLALLLYLYFYAMTANSQVILEVIYPSIATFIQTTSGVESSVVLVKVVWFIFVMSQLSNSQRSPMENEAEMTDKMVFLLEAQEDLSVVYTHHPALLYWAFSAQVNNNIQSKTVRLWLRNKTAECKELEELIGKSPDVRFTILDILQNDYGQVLDSAFSSMKTVLAESMDDDLASNIWFLLPQVLAKFTADSTSATNVDYVIELSSIKAPENVDVSKVIRIAFLLPEVLLKSDLISIVPSLKLTLQLLQLGMKMQDSRVVGAFLRFDGYLGKILDGLNSDVSDISTFSLKITSLLWKNGGAFREFGNGNKIKLDGDTMLEILANDNIQVVCTGLHFLQEVLLTSFRSSIFETDVDSTFIEMLFCEVLNICIKDLPDATPCCWVCLRLFLMVEPIQPELLTNPLLHEVIRFHLPRLTESQEMKEFLGVWTDLHDEGLSGSFLKRQIFSAFYWDSLRRVARTLREDSSEGSRLLYEKIVSLGFSESGSY